VSDLPVRPTWAYNEGLARKQSAFEKGAKIPAAIDRHRELKALKKTELSWMYAVSKCAPQEALRDLDQAFAHFFRRVQEQKSGKNIKVGFPRFKSRKQSLGSFRLTGTSPVFEKAIQRPRLGQRWKARGYLPRGGAPILNATVSERAGRWFVWLPVEREIPAPVMAEKPVAGVDLGINRLAQGSNSSYFDNPGVLVIPWRAGLAISHLSKNSFPSALPTQKNRPSSPGGSFCPPVKWQLFVPTSLPSCLPILAPARSRAT
jgi:putative transposase